MLLLDYRDREAAWILVEQGKEKLAEDFEKNITVLMQGMCGDTGD